MTMEDVAESIAAVAANTQFSGVARIEVAGETACFSAFGLADRRHQIPNTIETQFSAASGAKGLTALAVMSLIESGLLSRGTPVRSVLGTDLPLVDDRVTIEHLLTHRSGIGDYLDESAHDDINAYLMPVPVQQLASTPDYLPILDGHPQVRPPGEEFAYNNGGFVILALIVERVADRPFEDVIVERVCAPADMTNTRFIRSDALTPDIAVGYLDDAGWQTNVMHLPVLGSGDGGIFTTADDIVALWAAFNAGRIVSANNVDLMTEPVSDVPANKMRYGHGFWLHATGSAVVLEGYDAGVSFRTAHDPATGSSYVVLSNTSEGAWPIAREAERLLGI